ncbi:MAG: hypothetical protein IJY97_03655 [Clostridia bacterium]|nr:hypothetical protein [Clostridia bacterium]
MSAFYQIYRTFEGRFYYEFHSTETRMLLRGGERSTVALCRASIASLRIICDAPLEDTTGCLGEPTEILGYPKFKAERRGRGVYTVSLYAKNGKCVGRSRDLSTPAAALDVYNSVVRYARYAETRERIGGVTN